MVTMNITKCLWGTVLYSCTVCTVPVLCYIMQSQPTSGRTTTGRSTWTGTYLFLDLHQLYLELYISPWLSLKVIFRRRVLVVYMKFNFHWKFEKKFLWLLILFALKFFKNTCTDPKSNQEPLDHQWNVLSTEPSRHVVLCYTSLCHMIWYFEFNCKL